MPAALDQRRCASSSAGEQPSAGRGVQAPLQLDRGIAGTVDYQSDWPEDEQLPIGEDFGPDFGQDDPPLDGDLPDVPVSDVDKMDVDAPNNRCAGTVAAQRLLPNVERSASVARTNEIDCRATIPDGQGNHERHVSQQRLDNGRLASTSRSAYKSMAGTAANCNLSNGCFEWKGWPLEELVVPAFQISHKKMKAASKKARMQHSLHPIPPAP